MAFSLRPIGSCGCAPTNGSVGGKCAFRPPLGRNGPRSRAWFPCGSPVTGSAKHLQDIAGKNYPLDDCALTPSVAVVDPLLTVDLPPALAADSGFDALTHAIEAYVSVHANDVTDSLALHAIRLVFDTSKRR